MHWRRGCLMSVADALRDHRSAILVAPPGAGKTTLAPLTLMGEPWLAGQRIVMLEPRRLATRAAAQRMASLLGERVGDTVGYQTRDERHIGPGTRVEVVTEGVLTRKLASDPSLSGVSVVVIVGLLATLAVLYRRFTGTPDSGVAEKALVQGTFGLYLGWVCVAVCANIAVALVDSGVPPTGTGPAWATVAVLAAVVGIAAGVVWTPVPLVARCAAGAAVVWGLSWVAAGRLADAPSSALVGWSAAAAAAMVAIAVAVSARMVSTRSAA